MATLRSGTYGSYYGSLQGASEVLTTAEMQTNATYIYKYLTAKGWTINAVAGLLGNMQYESSINPGRWQSDAVGVGPAYGLVQWDPYTKYHDWCLENGYSDYSEMDANLDRIIYELNNNIQYYPTDSYPLTFKEFTVSTDTPYNLACAFAWNYERSAVVLWGTEAEKEALREKRGNAANSWYEYLTGQTPEPPNPDDPVTPTTSGKRKKYNFVLFNRRRRMYG